MSDLYKKASLVMLPQAVDTSKVYSIKPENRDGDFTFTRSTAATRVNADGNIEKETQNLLLQSNDFDTTWTNFNTTETGGQADKDGGTDAWLLTKSAGAASISQSISTSGVKSFSVYMKANASDWGLLQCVGGNNPYAYFNLDTGVVGSKGGGAIDSGIEDIANGWYRCTLVFNASISSARIYPAEANSQSATSGSIYIQDAQLEQGLVARDYIETTTAAVEKGITDNVPRLDYTDASCPSLLLEPQRSNLVTYSEYIAGLSLSSSPTVSIESETNPEGYSFVYKVTATTTSSRVQKNIGTQGNNMVYSGFFKGTGTATRLRIRNNQGNGVQYNIDASGNFTLHSEDAANDNYGFEDYGNGWYRVYFETTTVNNADNFIQVYPDSQHGTGSVYIWGLQVEQGSYATSYIPTYGSSVTRNAERGTMPSTSYDLSGSFSIFFDLGKTRKVSGGGSTAFYWLNTNQNDFQFYTNAGGGNGINVYLPNQGGYIFNSYGNDGWNADASKICVTYNANTGRLAYFINGTKYNEQTSVLSFTGSDVGSYVEAGSNNLAEIKKYMFFTQALSDEEVIDLTTL